MANIQSINNKDGELVYPVTHEKAVRDDNGNTLDSKIKALQETYAGLTQSDIIIGTLPASGVANTIYRVPGTNSYSDYMWDGTQFVPMATYNNAIDDVPTAGSENLVKSGGVANVLGIPEIYQVGVNLTTTNGRIDSTGTTAGGSSFKNITLNVNEGDIIVFTPTQSGVFYPSYGFAWYNANNQVLFVNTDQSLVDTEQYIKVPANARYFRVGFSNADSANSTYNTFKIYRKTSLCDNAANSIYDNLLMLSDSYASVYSAAAGVTSYAKLQENRVTRIDYTTQVSFNAVLINRIRLSETPSGVKYICLGFDADKDSIVHVYISKTYKNWQNANLVASFLNLAINKKSGVIVPIELSTLTAANQDDLFVFVVKVNSDANYSLYCGMWYKTMADILKEDSIAEDYTRITWNAVGDSITAQGLYITEALKIVPLNSLNYGLGSSTIAINNTYMSNSSIVERVCGLNGNTPIPDADLWTIMGGLNDCLYSSPLGALAPIGSTYDKTTVYGALQSIVEYVLSLRAEPHLLLITPTQSVRDTWDSTTYPTTMASIRQAIIDVGYLYSVPVLDSNKGCNVSVFNISAANNPTTLDGVHLNTLGGKLFGRFLAKKITDILYKV